MKELICNELYMVRGRVYRLREYFDGCLRIAVYNTDANSFVFEIKSDREGLHSLSRDGIYREILEVFEYMEN